MILLLNGDHAKKYGEVVNTLLTKKIQKPYKKEKAASIS